ncbi:MAG: dTDP-4-dehydrorhamnose reductase [Candidatus Aminicenantes bacterium RBG_16_63_16]|nr:MAG: dTDP-4-dehydrorhamnose reductase [Candidatus Aminicenantes bacterium RBG_16_63_16]
MKILLIGADGQLGFEVRRAFGAGVMPLTHKDIEVSDPAQTAAVIGSAAPGAVINTAAYHSVPECEKNPETAFRVNTLGARNIALACVQTGARFVHISTDYVFDGRKPAPYTEEDIPRPLNTYGVSKAAGEFFVPVAGRYYIIRTSGLFGIRGCRAKDGKNFVKTMLLAAKTRPVVEVSANVISNPTYARDAARKIKMLLEEDAPSGVYHIANSGPCSWYEFAREIFRQAGIAVEVKPRTETEEAEGIKRPLFTPLASVKTEPLRHWKEALGDYLGEEADFAKEE